MKRIFLLACAVGLLTACEKQASIEQPLANGGDVTAGNEAEVRLTFSPYEQTTMQGPGRRAATSIASIVTHLDVWLYESGTEAAAVHQTTSDAEFGTISVTLDKTKTYTLYAVGHKADGATLTDGVISFTDDKVTHAMFYSTTFTPNTTTELSCTMSRIVADFRLEITDDIPTSAVKFRFTIASVFDRWNVSTGGTHQLDRVSTINYNGTSSIFNIYAIVTDASTTHDITVEALDANSDVIQTRTFTNVPLRNGYKTTYRGTFFIDTPATASFLVDDWSEYDAVDF